MLQALDASAAASSSSGGAAEVGEGQAEAPWSCHMYTQVSVCEGSGVRGGARVNR